MSNVVHELRILTLSDAWVSADVKLQMLACLSPNFYIQEGKDCLVLYRKERGRETSLQAEWDAIESLRLATFQLPVSFQTGDVNEMIHQFTKHHSG